MQTAVLGELFLPFEGTVFAICSGFLLRAHVVIVYLCSSLTVAFFEETFASVREIVDILLL